MQNPTPKLNLIPRSIQSDNHNLERTLLDVEVEMELGNFLKREENDNRDHHLFNLNLKLRLQLQPLVRV
jgi:hypothetical protein